MNNAHTNYCSTCSTTHPHSGVWKALKFSQPLSRMPWKYYGKVIGTLSQKNSE